MHRLCGSQGNRGQFASTNNLLVAAGQWRARICAFATVFVLACMPVTNAATLFVSKSGADVNDGQSWVTAKGTVAAGLAAAASGDDVWVAAGTYVERITLKSGVGLYGGFAGGETLMTERDYAANVTILDGNSGGSVVTAQSGATASTRIDGFTIRNGSAPGGGGVNCSNASPTVVNNVIAVNMASQGAGISCVSSSAIILNNLITGNVASSSGGGIYCGSDSLTPPTVLSNRIVENRARDGAGIYVQSSVTIANNALVGNVAQNRGGGLYATGLHPSIVNNTFVGNSAINGGGIYCVGSSSQRYLNNLVAFNTSGIVNSSGTPTLENNCVHNPAGLLYSGLTAGPSNISVDPQIVGVDYGQVHLGTDSPCVDAGADSEVAAGWTDIDGQTRIIGVHVDIGADEFDGTVPAFSPRVVYVTTDGDDGHDGSTWELAKRSVQAGIDAAATTGGDVWVARGTYTERITLKAWVQVYGGFAGTETRRDARASRDQPTILDGSAGGSVVTATLGSGLCSLDGFTIRNGLASAGGGINCADVILRISNNRITGNTAKRGGGIHISTTGPKGGVVVIRGNIIENNRTTDNYDGGGGIACLVPVTIRENQIIGNIAGGGDVSGYGGGIFCLACSPIIAGNIITDNQAQYTATLGGYGGGIHVSGSGASSAPLIANNRIGSNLAGAGGGVCFDSNCGGVLQDNLIVANATIGAASGVGGGAVHFRSNVSATASNNTIVANVGPIVGGVYCSNLASPILSNNIIAFNSGGIYGGTPSLRRNCVFNPGWTDYTNLTPGSEDIQVDPQLLNLDRGDVHLVDGSPCIDGGDDAAVPPGAIDIDGQLRIQGGHVDIGADEFDGQTPTPASIRVVHVSPAGDDAQDGASWDAAKRTVQGGLNAAATSGGDVWVAAGTYHERITMRPWVQLYGGFTGTEVTRDERNWATNETILDGDAGGSVVSGPPGSGRWRIDGFTIRNGTGTIVSSPPGKGGGIYSRMCSPTIANNTITDCAVGSGEGGAVYCNWASPAVITENLITANSAALGTAISCMSSAVTIAGNTVSSNQGTADTSSTILCYSSSPVGSFTALISGNFIDHNRGIAISIAYSSSSLISGNMLADNTGRGISCESVAAGTIRDNLIVRGGAEGIRCSYASPLILNNKIAGNRVGSGAGIVCIGTSSPLVVNVECVGNTASNRGGAIYVSGGSPTFVNCTFSSHSAPSASDLYVSGGSATLSNCILWGGGTNPVVVGAGSLAMSNCDVQGGWSGTGNIDLNPRFTRPPSAGPDGTWGTVDDDYGDLRLMPGSPCIDAGSNVAAPADVLTDLAGRARRFDDPAAADCPFAPGTCGTAPIVDIGAYEAMSGDYDFDGDVDADDLVAFQACVSGPAVLATAECVQGDFDSDGDVDMADFGAFQKCVRAASE